MGILHGQPRASANCRSSPAHASMSDEQLLQCTMATGRPAGVVTMSISGYTRDKGFCSTIIAKMEVPADTLPVRWVMLFVATMPVPASPSGGQSGTPALSRPVGSSSFAPSAVKVPASSPAAST